MLSRPCVCPTQRCASACGVRCVVRNTTSRTGAWQHAVADRAKLQSEKLTIGTSGSGYAAIQHIGLQHGVSQTRFWLITLAVHKPHLHRVDITRHTDAGPMCAVCQGTIIKQKEDRLRQRTRVRRCMPYLGLRAGLAEERDGPVTQLPF